MLSIDDLQKANDLGLYTQSLLDQSNVKPDRPSYYCSETFQGVDTDLVYGGHFSSQAIELFDREVRNGVLGDKEQWMFLVEASDFARAPETKYFKKFAEEFNLPLVNPVISPYNLEVADISGVDEMLAREAFLVNEYPQYKNPVILARNMSSFFDVSLKEAKKVVNNYLLRKEEGLVTNMENYARKNLVKLMQGSNYASNLYAKKLVEQFDGSHIFCHVGEGHAEIFSKFDRPQTDLSIEEILEIKDYQFDRRKRLSQSA